MNHLHSRLAQRMAALPSTLQPPAIVLMLCAHCHHAAAGGGQRGEPPACVPGAEMRELCAGCGWGWEGGGRACMWVLCRRARGRQARTRHFPTRARTLALVSLDSHAVLRTPASRAHHRRPLLPQARCSCATATRTCPPTAPCQAAMTACSTKGVQYAFMKTMVIA